MENNNENIVTNQFDSQLPTTVSMTTKEFLTQSIYVSPEQQARRQAIHDFWHQEIDEEKVNEFLFQKMKF